MNRRHFLQGVFLVLWRLLNKPGAEASPDNDFAFGFPLSFPCHFTTNESAKLKTYRIFVPLIRRQ